MNAKDFFENGQKSAELAVRFDTSGQLSAALFYYEEASRYLVRAADTIEDHEIALGWHDKASEYHERSECILRQCEYIIYIISYNIVWNLWYSVINSSFI